MKYLFSLFLLVASPFSALAAWWYTTHPTPIETLYPFGTVLERDPDNPDFPYPIIVWDHSAYDKFTTPNSSVFGTTVSVTQYKRFGNDVFVRSYRVSLNGFAIREPNPAIFTWDLWASMFGSRATGTPDNALGKLLCSQVGSDFYPHEVKWAELGWYKRGSDWITNSQVEFLGVSGPPALSALRNLSTRKTIENGGTLISGFVQSGGDNKRFLIRAVGRSLAAFGVGGTMPNPFVKLYSADGRLVEANDDWNQVSTTIAEATKKCGAFPLSSANDAVLWVNIPPGAYTVHVVGADGQGGDVLVEIYEVP